MDKYQELRERAEADLSFFIRLVAPHRLLGGIHEELLDWWTRSDAKSHQLTLLPRAHQKSMLVAYRCAWWITKNPATTILYISSTSNLAEKQLKAIQDILTSKIYRQFWPEMVSEFEGKREKWTTTEFAVDHPKRKQEGVRDPTVFTAGLTTSITGLHCDVAVLDDVVVKENAYTEDGRQKVREQYSLLASIENADALEWVVGTRYHPKDLYQDLLGMSSDVYDENGDIVDKSPVFEVFQRKVEDSGDGNGEFLWPRHQREDGKWFGFNAQILSKKREQYLDRTQFYAQYYNTPNSPDSVRIAKEKFQYYEPKFLKNIDGSWWYKDNKLNVYAGMDFAFSVGKRSDFSVLVVVGVDCDSNYFVLDIDRFKTDKMSEMFSSVLSAYTKWGFRKMRMESTAAQVQVVRELKENYIKANGLVLSVEEYRPTRAMGNKEERIAAILEARYENGAIWHYRGGYTQILEEELTMLHPPHDDVKDALAMTVDMCIAPARRRQNNIRRTGNVVYHSKFGGVA